MMKIPKLALCLVLALAAWCFHGCGEDKPRRRGSSSGPSSRRATRPATASRPGRRDEGVGPLSKLLERALGGDERRPPEPAKPAETRPAPPRPKPPRPAPKRGKLTIAVVPKAQNHVYYQSIRAGVAAAAKKLDVELIHKGPAAAYDVAAQVSIVDSMIERGVDGIVLAPVDAKALQPAVRRAARAGVPVVAIDSPPAGKDHVSFVGVDNLSAGKLAGNHLAKLLGGKGRVAMLRFHRAVAATGDRERGFLEAVKANQGMTVVADPYAAKVESAFEIGQTLLERFAITRGVVAIDGVFCSAEPAGIGMLTALGEAKLTDKVCLVSFGRSPKLIDALKEGRVQALLVQDPVKIGRLGVETIVGHLKGGKVPKKIDTGVKLVTKKALAADASLRKLLGAE